MEKDGLNNIKVIEYSLRKVNRQNLKTFDFSKKDFLKNIEDELLYKLPYDLFATFYQYVDLIIEYVLEIRKNDCINVFAEGFKSGIEFERYLKEKYGK